MCMCVCVCVCVCVRLCAFVCVWMCVLKKKRKHWKQRHNVREKKKKNRERGKETECGSSISDFSLVVCAKGQSPPWPITHSQTLKYHSSSQYPPQYTLTSSFIQGFVLYLLLSPAEATAAGRQTGQTRHSTAPIGAIQYSLRYPRLIACFPSRRSLWTKGAGYAGVYLPKTAYILPFLVNTGRERHRDRHSVSVCLFAVWERVEGERVIPSWDWIRGGIVFGSLGVSQLRHSDMISFWMGACENFSSWVYWSITTWEESGAEVISVTFNNQLKILNNTTTHLVKG